MRDVRSLLWKNMNDESLMCGAPVMLIDPKECCYFSEDGEFPNACVHSKQVDRLSRVSCRCTNREALIDVRMWEI